MFFAHKHTHRYTPVSATTGPRLLPQLPTSPPQPVAPGSHLRCWPDGPQTAAHLGPFSRTTNTTDIMEAVAIFDAPGKGRGLKATKEMWAGDVVFSEAGLAAVVFDR